MLRLGRALQRAPVRVVRARGYHENIIDHYENPRNVGSLDKSDPAVGTRQRARQRRAARGRLSPRAPPA